MQRPESVDPSPMMRAAAVTSVLAVLLAWMLVLVEFGDNDGAAGNLIMFVVPSLCVAVLCVFAVTGGTLARLKKPHSWLWWPLAVMPAGVLGALAASVVNHPDYYIGEESPWMLL